MKKLIITILLLSPLISFAGIQDNLVGWWRMDSNDISGTNLTDNSGNGNTGTLVNSPTTVAGQIGQGLQFNGSSQNVNIGHPASLNLTSSFTYGAWFKADTIHTGYIIAKRSDVGNGYNVYVENTGGLTINVSGGVPLGVSYKASKWYHIMLVVQSNGTTITPYLNGVAYPDVNFVGFQDVPTQDLRIGSRNSSVYYDGAIDDVRIYNRALSANEIKQLYRFGLVRRFINKLF